MAVHPEDDRYAKYVGKTAIVPMLGREIPVIADELVDKVHKKITDMILTRFEGRLREA